MAMTHDQRIIYEYLDEVEPYTKEELAFELGNGEERVGIALQALVQKSAVVRDSTTIPATYRRR
jgi:predicted transcriptional regulator